jgi:Na+-translocating ferredoxin:NAD+ oxidoreductase RnfD subunit
MVARLKRGRKKRICQLCGSSLQSQALRKYDRFWTVCLIALGSMLTWYLFGVLLMAAGVWLFTRKKMHWVCPVCAAEPVLRDGLIS